MILKKTILFFVLLIPIVSALEFSPTSLQFSLEKNEISCKKINFEIESSAKVHDTWAQNSLEQWSITNFKTNSQEHEIELSYPAEISPEEKELQVCISGSKPGDYRGTLIFREEKVGNSIIQFAVWLKLHINASSTEDDKPTPPEDDGRDSRTSGRSHKSSSSSQTIYYASRNSSETYDFQTLNFPTTQEKIRLNQPQKEVAATQNSAILILTIPALIAILFIVLIVSKRRKS